MESSVLTKIFLAAALFIIMLGMGLSLTPLDFKRVLRFPKAMAVGLLNQLVLLPALGFIIAAYVAGSPEIAVGLIILAACPGGSTSNLITHLSKGDTALSVSLTAVSSLVTIITIPFIINIGLNQFMAKEHMISMNIPETILQILIITVIPVSIGMYIRSKKQAFAEKMTSPVKVASAVVLALVIAGIIISEKDNFIMFFRQAGISALALNLTTMAAGMLSGWVMNLNMPQRISVSIESGIQNGTLAIFIATSILKMPSLAIAPAVYSLIMFGTGMIMIFIFGRKKKKLSLL